MACLSLGQRLFDHQIQPIQSLTNTSKTKNDVGSWIASHITRRMHHGAVALAHIPAALIDLAGAIICSLGSVFAALANAATFNQIDSLEDLSAFFDTQAASFWMGVGHAIPGIFSHAVSVVNANAISNPHNMFISEDLVKSTGGYIGMLPTGVCKCCVSAAIDHIKNPVVRHVAARIIALVSLVIVPTAKLLDLAPGLLFTLAVIVTLGMWEKANTEAYRHLYSVSTILQDIHFFAVLLINPTDTTSNSLYEVLDAQSERSKSISKKCPAPGVLDYEILEDAYCFKD